MIIYLHKRILTLVVFSFHLIVNGQDYHFSQFNSSPLFINPGATGAFNGEMRFSANYKNQWKTISNAYNTYGASIDGRILSKKSNFIGIGLTAFSDKSGLSKLSTTQINALVSYNLKITRSIELSAGIQLGMFQKKLTTGNLKWDNQFDGNFYNSSLPTGETSNFQQITNFDSGLGILCRYNNKSSQFKFEIGASISHINKPKSTFLANDQKINRKYIGHISSHLKLGDKPFFIIPQAIYVNQSPYSEILFGGSFKCLLGEETRSSTSLNTFALVSSTISFGAFYRMKDAIICVVNLEYKRRLNLGFSYDFNTSKLSAASKHKAGMEISLAYKLMMKNGNIKNVPLD